MLWVAKENPGAIAFYVRNGFSFDGVENIDPVAPMITDAQMVRQLAILSDEPLGRLP